MFIFFSVGMIITTLVISLFIQILGQPFLKWPIYQVSLFYTKKIIDQNHWWHKVPDQPIYIGALPLLEENHHSLLKDLNVTHVLSILEPFELEDSFIASPVKPGDWDALGIHATRLDAEDFKPVSQETLYKAVQSLNLILEHSKSTVYIHCKAGRGRSASILLTYLSLHRKNFTFEENYTFLQSIRPAINLRDDQKNAVLTYLWNHQSLIDHV